MEVVSFLRLGTDQTQRCYCDFMAEEIKARFGDHFIDIQGSYRFGEYFGRQIEKIVQKDGWTPAEIRKQKVNSMLVLRVFFE